VAASPRPPSWAVEHTEFNADVLGETALPRRVGEKVLTKGMAHAKSAKDAKGVGELDLGFWMFNFSPQLRDTLTRGLRKRYSRPTVAGRVTAFAWRAKVAKPRPGRGADAGRKGRLVIGYWRLEIGDWGLGIGDWRLGIGYWGEDCSR